MKITLGPISFDILPLLRFCLLLFRVCLPATIFIVLCTLLFLGFFPVLYWLDDHALNLIGWAWLTLLLLYIVLGVAFTFFTARYLQRIFGSEPKAVRRAMALLSAAPFYAILTLFVLMFIASIVDPVDCAAGLFLAFVGTIGFGLICVAYLLLLRLFSGRTPALAQA